MKQTDEIVDSTDVVVVTARDACDSGDFRFGRTSFISHSGSLIRADINWCA